METPNRRRLVAAFLTSAALAALLATTPAVSLAASNPAHQPDGRVRGGYTSTWQGDNVYNGTAAHQKAIGGTLNPPAGEVHKFKISIQNDGTAADRIRVKAAGSGQGWTIQYFHLTSNITSQVVAGTFRTPSLAPGASYLVKAKLTTRAHPLKVVRLVTLTSVAQAAKTDAIKFVMLVNSVDCPPPGC